MKKFVLLMLACALVIGCASDESKMEKDLNKAADKVEGMMKKGSN